MPGSSPTRPIPSIVSTRFDATWFVGPGLVAAVVGAIVGWLPTAEHHREDSGFGLWLVGVVLVDVAHVYASLYRTYLDPQARRLHRKRLIWAPLLCLWFGVLLHLESPLLFWSVLAYVAIFHFIKQHLGFALLYVRAGGETPLDRRLVTAAIWAGTLGPVLYWHANLPTKFAWFIAGDLVSGAPHWLGSVALLAQVPIWIAFVGRRLQRRWAGLPRNPLLVGLVVLPAINWHLGIVVFDDDRVFTITNVFFHGIPYLALVWVAGGRSRVRTALDRGDRPWSTVVIGAVFYGVLATLAITEEALWDRLVWHDHAAVFGATDTVLTGLPAALVVALLTVPQATHYLLDRWIWRVGPDNPELATQLGFAKPPSRPGP